MTKHNYLCEIHAAPESAWSSLCQYLLDNEDCTIAKIKSKAKTLSELSKTIPDWWDVDLASITKSVVNDQQYAQRLTDMFKLAGDCSDGFGIETLYRHEDTSE